MVYNESKYNKNWKTMKLSDLGEFARGKSTHRPRNDKNLFEGGGYPLVQTGEIKEANLYITHHTQEYGEFGLQQSKLWDAETLCITIAANIAETALLAYPMCFPDSVVGFKAYKEVSSEKFMYYVFDFIRNSIQNAASGSTQDNINIDYLTSLDFKVPDKIAQDKMVELLSAIDEKILMNSKINDNLEQQIKTIFTFQFLQNANTEWKQQSLVELSEMYQPKTISGKDLIADGNYFVYGANGIIGKYNQYNHSESEIAVACRGASCGSIQMTLPFSWITGNAMVVKPHSDFPYREYLYYYLLAKNPNYLCSGSAQPQLTRENLTLYSLKVPSTTELNAFESYAEKVRKIIIKNQQENIELSTLRDWLLPMLMNGQATISN